jgi:hypothetical protein
MGASMRLRRRRRCRREREGGDRHDGDADVGDRPGQQAGADERRRPLRPIWISPAARRRVDPANAMTASVNAKAMSGQRRAAAKLTAT